VGLIDEKTKGQKSCATVPLMTLSHVALPVQMLEMVQVVFGYISIKLQVQITQMRLLMT
jgi:hypothetical protein